MPNKKFLFAIISALFIILFSKDTKSQYFGQNKVIYESFNFKELHTEHFDIYFYPEEQRTVKYAAKMAERWYARHVKIFSDTLNGRQPLILYSSFPQFTETNVTQGFIGQGTGGFTEPLKRRIVLPFAGPLNETDHVIGHELVHAFQYDITKSTGAGALSRSSIERLPLWFIEGMAEYFSLGPDDPFTAMWMRDAALKDLPDISDLNSPEFFPYRYGQALLSFIGGKYGDDKLVQILTASDSLDVESAIDTILRITPDSLSTEWHAALHAQYDSLKKITKMPEDYGRALIEGKDESEALNVSPVLSPDGKNIAFYSSRNLFSIDIFLADAETGKIKRTILETELDPHLQSLEFINSAGAWNSNGNKFIFSTIKDGRPALSILNIENNKIENEIRFDSLGQILNPSWSPDDKSIVFSALSNGLTDLFIYNFYTRKLKRLTNDAYADLQPEWSPDGNQIAFVTDKFSTNLDNLDIGNYQIALIDPENGDVKSLNNFDKAKNINPQWSEDGKHIYFLSDKNGITNIYDLNLELNKINQLTNLYGGVSGITSLSPALTAASGKIVYSAYKNGQYSIYSLDSNKIETKAISEMKINAGILPPENRLNNLLVQNLNNPNLGTASQNNFNISDYDASLSLTGVIQPSIGVGVSNYGANIGGGVGLYWTDMLGNHNLLTAFQIQSYRSFKFTDITAVAQYLNTSSRWNWGGTISQIPYILSGYNAGYSTIQGEPVFIDQQIISKQINREVSGMIAYPFSQILRAEFYAGFQNIAFTNEAITTAVSLVTGQVIRDDVEELSHPPSLNMVSFGSALVLDNSIFGATGPLLGQRFRIEANPTFGSLNIINLLADFRKYLMPVRPFTLAGRILHLARYGSDAEDNRISPLFIGYPGLVRGYESNSFNATEFLFDSSGNNLNYNELFGSKMLIANFELRFPLFGALGIGSGFYGILPIDFGIFYDAGTAWTSSNKPKIFGGNRKLATSFGGLLRINLFGFAIAEVDYVHPFNRPGDKWLWQFNLIQGF